MKRMLFIMAILLASLMNLTTTSAQPTGYYNGTENKQGEELKAVLNDIISNQMEWSYFYSKEIFKLSDADPNNPNNIIQIYTGKSWDNDDYGSGGNQLNREHIWAKSHGNFEGIQPMDGDVHNLKPVDASVNNDKSNLDYDNGGNAHPEAIGCFFDNDSWEPRDADKGDVARIILYMDTRYEGENGEIDLTAVDQVNTYPQPYHGKLSTLLQWNLQDPPDDFERNRNNVIYSFQQNRNPFIDNPYFAELIWNNAALSTVTIGNVVQSPENPQASQQITISAAITSTSGSITGATLYYGTSWNNLAQNVSMTGSGNTYTGTIPGQNQGTTVYFRIQAQDDSGSAQTVIYNFYVLKTFSGTLTSIRDIQGQGNISPFDGQVVSTSGIVTGNFGTNYFIQSGSGPWSGLYIYDFGRNPKVGDSIIITGTIDEYYEKTEMKDVTGYYVISSGNPLPDPVNITCAQAGEQYESVLVSVNNATCTNANYMADFYMWTVNDGTGSLKVHNSAVFEFEPTESEVYLVTGPLDYDFDEWKIQLRFEADVQAGNDISAPQIVSVSVVTSTNVMIMFSESVDQATAQNVANYSINKGVTVSQAILHSFVKTQVNLTVSALEGGDYELTVQNVKDLVGNAMSQVIVPFNSTGVNEQAEMAARIYPNPTSGKINIEWLDPEPGTVSVNLFNCAGIRVLSNDFPVNGANIMVMDAGDLKAGLYILEIRSEEKFSHTKLMIR